MMQPKLQMSIAKGKEGSASFLNLVVRSLLTCVIIHT